MKDSNDNVTIDWVGPVKPVRGHRPRVHASNAERQKAYRGRLRAGQGGDPVFLQGLREECRKLEQLLALQVQTSEALRRQLEAARQEIFDLKLRKRNMLRKGKNHEASARLEKGISL